VKQTLTVAGIVFVITVILMYFLMEQVFSARLASAPMDTTSHVTPHETPSYEVKGPVVKPAAQVRKPRPPEPLITPPAIQDSGDTLNCLTVMLLNTVGRLNAELCEVKDSLRWAREPDSFEEDSLRYRLSVVRDPNVSPRWWRWLQIKPYPYSDTTSTVTQTLATQGKMDWPWLIAALCVGATIMALLYSVAFK
jgi:hypothetical protein